MKFVFVEKLIHDKIINEIPKLLKSNDVNCGASTSGINTSSKPNHESVSTKLSSNSMTTQNQTKSNSNVKNIPQNILLTPEQIALEQIMWVNKMYAIRMAEYWKSLVLLHLLTYVNIIDID